MYPAVDYCACVVVVVHAVATRRSIMFNVLSLKLGKQRVRRCPSAAARLMIYTGK